MFVGRLSIVTTPRFEAGQLVRHKRYGYRGVVLQADGRCEAPEAWYRKNQTQPDRRQAWYHVLVHGGDAVTYAAQENLLPDESAEPIDHPLVPHFFDGFEDGRHRRNDKPWPGWDA